MTPKHQRLSFLLAGLLLAGVAAALILTAFQRNLVYFYTPTDILAQKPPPGKKLRLGGMVLAKSLTQEAGDAIAFTVTDGAHGIRVHYKGLLPNLFREGQGVIAEGSLAANGDFEAWTILAKHDENYMPPEVAKRLKAMGHWKTDYPVKP